MRHGTRLSPRTTVGLLMSFASSRPNPRVTPYDLSLAPARARAQGLPTHTQNNLSLWQGARDKHLPQDNHLSNSCP